MRFKIQGRLPNLNEYINACRTNKFVAAKMKRETEEMIMWQIPKHEPFGKVKIHFTWIEPNMKRDKDNSAFAKKFILDALVKKGILPNDGWENVEGFTDSFEIDKSNPGVIVEVENC